MNNLVPRLFLGGVLVLIFLGASIAHAQPHEHYHIHHWVYDGDLLHDHQHPQFGTTATVPKPTTRTSASVRKAGARYPPCPPRPAEPGGCCATAGGSLRDTCTHLVVSSHHVRSVHAH